MLRCYRRPQGRVLASETGLKSTSQFSPSPSSATSAWIFLQSKLDGSGSYATALPFILNNRVPPNGASSCVVLIVSMFKLYLAKQLVSLWTMPGLSAPLSLKTPENPTSYGRDLSWTCDENAHGALARRTCAPITYSWVERPLSADQQHRNN